MALFLSGGSTEDEPGNKKRETRRQRQRQRQTRRGWRDQTRGRFCCRQRPSPRAASGAYTG
ncbi:hypothetical protein CCMA1212_005236 [Trichoderma ghanense]|uniref:Uncharacterized protein n=1 Tax=Trichoderma ghanense TaxID=65468 RepID=A0ABY2H5S3_9HYPO